MPDSAEPPRRSARPRSPGSVDDEGAYTDRPSKEAPEKDVRHRREEDERVERTDGEYGRPAPIDEDG